MFAEMFDVKDCLVSFKTTQSVKLRILFESLHAILGDALLDFTPDGVFLSASTANGVIVMNMLKENIEEYVCTQNVECGIKFSAMYAYLKNVTDTDVVGIQVTRDGYNGAGNTSPSAYLFVCNSGAEGKCDAYRSMYQIRLLVLNRFEITQMMPEELYMDACVTLPSTTFQRFLRSHEKVDSSPDLDIQILAHVPDPGPDGTLPTQGDVYFVSDGQDAHLVTSSSFPILRATDDTSDVFKQAFVTDPDDPSVPASSVVEMDSSTTPPPPELIPDVSCGGTTVATASSSSSSAPKQDSVKFVIDSRFLKIETSLFYAHRSSDKKEQYSLKMLLEIAKMTGMSHSVRLFLAPDAPLAIVYDIGTLGSVLLFVAPRQEEVVNCSLKTVITQAPINAPVLASMRVVNKKECDRPAPQIMDSTVVDRPDPPQGQKRARKPGSGRPRKYPPGTKRPKKGQGAPMTVVAKAAAAADAEDDPMDETALENADGDELEDHEVFQREEHGL